MQCEHDDCFTCPYPDCVLDVRDACYSPEKIAERIRKRKEYQRQWYQKRKAKKEAQHEQLQIHSNS